MSMKSGTSLPEQMNLTAAESNKCLVTSLYQIDEISPQVVQGQLRG
jgi:hypothetical protein